MENTTQQNIAKFEPQIAELVAYAKAIKFDIQNGDVKELVRSWFASGVSFYNSPSDEQIFLIKGLVK